MHRFMCSNRKCLVYSVDIVESEKPASALELATQKRTELTEQLAEIDDEIVDLFLNDSLSSTEQLAAAIGLQPSLSNSPRFSWALR